MPLWLILDDFLDGKLKYNVENLKRNKEKWEINMKNFQKEEEENKKKNQQARQKLEIKIIKEDEAN